MSPAARSQEPAGPQTYVKLHLLGRRVALERTLKPSAEPVLDAERRSSPHEELLLKLYGEVCSSWRALVDVRFKLLGLVPTVSAALLAALLLRKPDDRPDPTAGVIIALFGLTVIVAIAVYDQRNSQLHDELISRARRIEHELGIAVGQFIGRPKPWRFVAHDVALAAIYGATIAAWTAAAVYFAIQL